MLLHRKKQVITEWPGIVFGFSRVLPHAYGDSIEGTSTEGSPIQSEDFLVKALQQHTAAKNCCSYKPELHSVVVAENLCGLHEQLLYKWN